MTEKRKNDSEEHTWFRSQRVFQEQGQWYFYTREGKVEGPFIDEIRVRQKLEAQCTLSPSAHNGFGLRTGSRPRTGT